MTGAKSGTTSGACGGRRCTLLRHTLITAVSLVLPILATPAPAQQLPVTLPQLAQLQTERSFDIPPQALTDALVAFGQQSGIQVTVDGTLARNLSSPAVRGTMTGQQALTRLLAGSGLTYVIADDATVVIERPERPGGNDTILLDPLVVEGALREDPRGAVEGYRATRSVTGTRLDVPLDEQPLPIQVLPRDVIEDAGATRLDDIVRLSTSGAIGNSRGGTQEFFTIRGFEASVVRNGAGTFGLAQQTDTANVERVEVLRGPGSALYGEGAPGGVINVITKRPGDSFFVESSSEASSLIRLRQELDVNLPLAETWDLNARVVGALEGTDSFRFRDEYDETFAEDRQFLAPSLSFSPTPTTDVLVSGEYLRSSDVFDRGVPLNDDGSLAADVDDFFGDPDVGNIESETLSAQMEIAQEITDGLSLRLFGSAVRNDFEGLSLEPNVVSPLNLDAATAAALGLPGPLVAGDTILRIIRNRDLQREVYSFQSDLNGSVSLGPVTQDLLLSFEYQSVEADAEVQSSDTLLGADPVSKNAPGTPSPLTPDDLLADVDSLTEIETFGLIFFDKISLYERLHILAGGRLDFLDQRFENRRSGSVTKIDETEFSPRVGAVLEPFAGLPASVFVSYSESFQPNTALAADGGVLAPQTGRVIEGGLRYGFNRDRLEATLTVFDIELENVPIGTDSIFSAASTQESRGVEFTLQGALTDNLSVLASYAFIDAEVTEIGAGGSQLTLGESPPGVARHSASFLARYRFDEGALDGLSLVGSLQYAGRRLNVPTTENPNPLGGPPFLFEAIELEPFVRLDMGFAYEVAENFTIEGGVRNLLNQEIAFPGAGEFAIPEPPITGFAGVRIRF